MDCTCSRVESGLKMDQPVLRNLLRHKLRKGPFGLTVRLIGVLIIAVVLLTTRADPVAAQAELQMWLNPEMGKQIPRADYRLTYYPDRAVDNQEAHFGWMEHRVSMFMPLYQDSKDEFALAAKGLFLDIDTSAILPDTGGRFPSELWDVSAGLSYRHKFDNSWTAGVAVTFGMHHGGPFPATTSPLHTSVGMTATDRFTRPIAFQDAPDEALPPELRRRNELGIRRRVDGGFESV